MYIEGSDLRKSLNGKICIIGSGIGGGSVIEALISKGLNDLILIEAGGLNENSQNIGAEITGRPFNMPVTRAIQLGGTSNLWGGGG